MKRPVNVRRVLVAVVVLLAALVMFTSLRRTTTPGHSSGLSVSASLDNHAFGGGRSGGSQSLLRAERRDEARRALASNRSDVPQHSQNDHVTMSTNNSSNVTTNTSAPIVPCRLVALGDIHGDFVFMRAALVAAKIIDRNGVWIGGCATLVQTGDVVDRGEHSIRCLTELERLKKQAQEYGGHVITLLGNHELMNIMGNANYAHPFEVDKLGGSVAWQHQFEKGGPFWNRFLDSPIAVEVGTTVFVHGGLLPEFANMGLKHINTLARKSLAAGRFDISIFGDRGPLWTRDVIMHAKEGSCAALASTLKTLGASRMVIGHTIQEDGHVHAYCEGKLIAIDTGLSRALLGRPAALELLQDGTPVPIYPDV